LSNAISSLCRCVSRASNETRKFLMSLFVTRPRG
jgi:hypothetical protein